MSRIRVQFVHGLESSPQGNKARLFAEHFDARTPSMDTKDYEQIPFTREQVGDAVKYLTENLDVSVLFWNGNPLTIELPSFIEAKVTECEPGLKGDTASGGTKPATLEPGVVVQVPLFIKEGEVIRVDTRTGAYVERVN